MFLTIWPCCPVLVYRPYSQCGCSPAFWQCESVCDYYYSTTTQCQAAVCMPAHIYGRREVAPSLLGKMWCRMLCCGEMSTYYGTSQEASEMWTYKHHLSICAHTLVHKILLSVCFGGYNTSVTTFAHSKKKSFCCWKYTHVNNDGLIQPSRVFVFSCWISQRFLPAQSKQVCELAPQTTGWREEKNNQQCVCVLCDWGLVWTKLLCLCTHTCPGVMSINDLWIEEPCIVHVSRSRFTVSVSLLCSGAGNRRRANISLFLEQLSSVCYLVARLSHRILNIPRKQNKEK